MNNRAVYVRPFVFDRVFSVGCESGVADGCCAPISAANCGE